MRQNRHPKPHICRLMRWEGPLGRVGRERRGGGRGVGGMAEDVRVPEGDVVWRTADRLHRALAERVLTTCDLRWPSLATVDEGQLVGHLGPDVLGADWDAQKVLATLSSQPDREIGDALLDQRVLAGVGTMFMAESLFVRGISPWTPVRDVPDPQALLAL